MSEVEETIERIRVQEGVENYVICNRQGQVLRRRQDMVSYDRSCLYMCVGLGVCL